LGMPPAARVLRQNMSGEEFPNHVLEKMDAKVKELALTESQQETYREIRTRVKNELAEMADQRKALFEAVKREMDMNTPDLEVLAGLLKSRSKRFPERMAFFVDQFMGFYGVLDTEQKGKVIAHFKEKFKRFEAFRALVCD